LQTTLEIDTRRPFQPDDLLHLVSPQLSQLALNLFAGRFTQGQRQPHLFGPALDGVEEIAGQCRGGSAERRPSRNHEQQAQGHAGPAPGRPPDDNRARLPLYRAGANGSGQIR
jgi:hypothetical protein